MKINDYYCIDRIMIMITKYYKFWDFAEWHLLGQQLIFEKGRACIKNANKYIEDTKPWILAKENKVSELKEFIYNLVDVIKKVSGAIAPFMPHTARLIDEQLGKQSIKKGKPLFPRIEI